MSGFNYQLAFFLMQRCMQAYKQYETNGSFEIPKGYQPVSTFKAHALNADTFNTDAFNQKAWFGYIIESPYSIIVVFRGTRSISDWLNNLDFPQTNYHFVTGNAKTHTGFTEIYSSCRDRIIDALQWLSPRKQLFITGHSLGGALATLNALDVAANTRFKHPTMINFGSPRVGNTIFAEEYNARVKNSIRIVNVRDIVPHLPFRAIKSPLIKRIWRYQHVNKKLPIAFHTGSIIGNHVSHNYYKALKNIAGSKFTLRHYG